MSLTPDYLAQDTSRVLFNVTTAVTILTTLVYILFLISRVFCVERNNLEVWIFPVLSYIFCVGLWTLSYLLYAEGGAGRHIAYWFIAKPAVITTYLKIQTAAEFVYVAACLFPKLTILALYLRLFTNRTVRIGAWIVIGVCIAHAFANIVASFTICRPFEYKWNKTIPGGRCSNPMASYRFVSLPHILTDIAIFLLPWSSLYHLMISKKQKLGLCLTFLIGSLGMITAIIRCVSFFRIDLESDPTWYAPTLFSYTIVEPSAYLICSSFLSLRPMLRMVYMWTRTKVDSYYGTGTSRSGQSEITLSHLKGGHRASISAIKSLSRGEDDDRKSNFIRLDETVDVDVSPPYGAGRV
ncbi:hypothetical protein P154DRAFT_451456 [Amniculicola lignicola CBS 123094]|uniref:Rhodopsin domain-containing protein n=1 Tax=Amniculicola lignicola CBS 123094 TaxID=1392246 RepID=A0A6A5VVS2_9PLEO|nr:hypothetical protein P154DRAFT_451456 [Amniculicola lignicola CBS 123094]